MGVNTSQPVEADGFADNHPTAVPPAKEQQTAQHQQPSLPAHPLVMLTSSSATPAAVEAGGPGAPPFPLAPCALPADAAVTASMERVSLAG